MEKVYQERIGYDGDVGEISRMVCENFNLGDFVEDRIITSGYEDFNLFVKTTKGSYVAKIFADFRDLDDCKRYVNIMLGALEAKVRHPRLYKSNQGHLHVGRIGNSKLRLCVMDFVDGEDLSTSGYSLNENDIRLLAEQASLINSIDLRPRYVYDSWAIVNFIPEFERIREYLDSEDLELIEPLVDKFRDIDVSKLPHCFVHGDIITTNVIRDKNEDLWIIDFAVSNYYPRLQEIAVLACNLFFDERDKKKSEQNLETALDEYQKKSPLSDKELNLLQIS
jgi:Ser/Thr protein kinase RdoA (MazF antagonist)